MTKFLLVFLVLCIAVSMYSCKPDPSDGPKPNNPTDTTFIPQIVKDYSWFDLGTYWVYQDSATGLLDSINVTNAKYTIVSRGYSNEPLLGIYQEMEIEMKSAVDQSEYFFYSGSCLCKPQNYRPIVEFVKSKASGGVNYSGLIYYPFERNKPFATGSSGQYTLIDSIGNYSVDGNNYTGVLIFRDSHDGTMGYDSSLTWVAKNYGIIRKQSLQSKKAFWLKRSHVNQ